MYPIINQNAKRDINNANVMVIVYKEGKIETYDENEGWDVGFGESCRRFHYRNTFMSYIGRDKEKQWLNDFLNESGNFIVSAITGKAGIGKSGLLYNFYRDNLNRNEWLIKGIDFERVNDVLVQKIFERQKVLLVIDYVLIHADEIGAWIHQLHRATKNNKNMIIRILLIERAHVTKDRIPYWYSFLVKKHNNEGICRYENFLEMEDLPEEDLKEVFKNYVIWMSEIEQKKSKQEIEQIKKRCEQDIPQIFKQMDVNCKTPLFVQYIAKAWLEGGKENIRNWDRDGLLEYIEKKEEWRIRTLFKGDFQKLKKILCFSMALSGINLGGGISEFIKDDIISIGNEIGAGFATLKAALYDLGTYNDKEVQFKSAMPEIVEEFFCLQYLKSQKDNFNTEYVKEFVEAAWKESPQAFAGFLCRVVEDFYDHELTTFTGILAVPSNMTFLQKSLYADIVREYTYWNINVKEYSEEVIRIFNSLLRSCENDEERKIVVDKYAVTLFNMIWNGFEIIGNVVNIDDNDIALFFIFESKLRELKEQWEDSCINEVYENAIAIMLKNDIFIG